MRITQARAISQFFFFGLLIFLLAVTEQRELKGYPVSLLLELDPLAGLATALAAHELFRGLLWSLAVLIPTFLLGRIFCGWICPFGALNHFIDWAFGPARDARPAQRLSPGGSDSGGKSGLEANRYRPAQQLKVLLLLGLLVAATAGSLQIGLLDPLCLLHRSLTAAFFPGVAAALPRAWVPWPRVYAGAWLIGLLLILPVALNFVIPRFFCRVLCPLGALLGLCARFSLWRIERNPQKCHDCRACARHCVGGCEPDKRLRKSECFVCFNCLEDCPSGAIEYRLLPPREHEVKDLEIKGRRAALAVMGGFLFYGFLRASGSSRRHLGTGVIRPPGAVEETEFLERCIKCGQCLRVCPTNVLQPAALEAGIEGLWTPLLNMSQGYCEFDCALCGEVCPTGAIQPITVEEKWGLDAQNGARGPVRLGTAFIDRGRCLPWAMGISCVVCEEVCPTSPKAIYGREAAFTVRDGRTLNVRQPYVEPAQCIGCGICENQCPVKAAVRVTAIGETRGRISSL